MLFALTDYLLYVARRGRYGKDQEDGGMAMAFVDEIPPEFVKNLDERDILFTQRLDSLKSWAMMYMTSSPIDHAAIYIGGGEVFHMTLGGAKKHSLRALTKGARVLPVRFAPSEFEMPFDPPEGRGKMVRRSRPSHILPPKLQLLWVALRIALGFHPERYKWKFLADIVILSLVIDFAAITLGAPPIAVFGTAIAALISIFNAARFTYRSWRGQSFALLSHPDIGYYSFFRIGGVMHSKLGPLAVSEIGILPVHAFLALGRESANHGSADELQYLRERARDILELWRSGPARGESEHHKGDQHDHE
jgi:hypothetical protein